MTSITFLWKAFQKLTDKNSKKQLKNLAQKK